MKKFSQVDYLGDYETFVTQLKSNTDNLDLKHKAVLALARMGSLDFARIEFERYGLDKVRNHEDIMALNGRLSKDLYLVTTGKSALSHAQNASEKYEAAFQDTQGYYSGINAATMALLADMPWETIKARIDMILGILPPTENLTSEDHYFIEATRAECFLLLGKSNKAQDTLRGAIAFDPLNYTAHASTLKQFALILDKRQESKNWLANFKPPRAAHFGGHLWLDTDHAHQNIPEILSDLIQENDIGFGYGALAAGADILFAEALLQEGGELNAILPADIESFANYSVGPYGDDWLARFNSCLDRANSVTCLPNINVKDSAHIILSARMAMGQAILRGHQLDVAPIQVLMLDPEHSKSLTLIHQLDWKEAGLDGHEIAIDKKINLTSVKTETPKNIPILLRESKSSDFQRYDTLEEAIDHIQHAEPDMSAIHFNIPGSDGELETMMSHNFSDSILTSEVVASYAALKFKDKYKLTFAGVVSDKSGKHIRTYTLRALG